MTARGSLTAAAACRSLSTPREAGESVIDISAVDFLDPSGLVAIACFAHERAAIGDEVRLIRPVITNTANYVAASGLDDVFDDLGIVHDLPPVARRDAETLLRVKSFEKAEGARLLAEHVLNALRVSEPAAAVALSAGICEAGDNVQQHANAPAAFVAAQSYPKKRTMSFTVGDSGQGMLATLSPRGAESHLDAITLALDGQSRKRDRGRGLGIPSMRKDLLALHGTLTITSGDTSVTSRNGRPPEVNTHSEGHGFRGVIVRGEVSVGVSLSR